MAAVSGKGTGRKCHGRVEGEGRHLQGAQKRQPGKMQYEAAASRCAVARKHRTAARCLPRVSVPLRLYRHPVIVESYTYLRRL